MSGRPKTLNNPEPCSGDWACDPVGGHCACWWDASKNVVDYDDPTSCCQCSHDGTSIHQLIQQATNEFQDLTNMIEVLTDSVTIVTDEQGESNDY